MTQHDPIAQPSIWFKIKKIFSFNLFGSSKTIHFDSLQWLNESRTLEDYHLAVKSWLQHVDSLHTKVKQIRSEIDISRTHDLSIETLGSNTYLFHVDRLLVKLRELMHGFKYRLDQNGTQFSFINRPEVSQFCVSALNANQTVLNITAILKTTPVNKLYHQGFVNLIHNFEQEVSLVANAVRALNQCVYHQDTFYQLAEIEKSILNSLESSRRDESPVILINPEKLYIKARTIQTQDAREFMMRLIESYDLLKKCYVISRKQVVSNTLMQMANQMDAMIDMFAAHYSQPELDNHLAEIFAAIESLRFSANHASRCSKILFEKTKIAKTMIRVACKLHPDAFAYLQKRSIKRERLVPKRVEK